MVKVLTLERLDFHFFFDPKLMESYMLAPAGFPPCS
jgi:hypothetical protein